MSVGAAEVAFNRRLFFDVLRASFFGPAASTITVEEVADFVSIVPDGIDPEVDRIRYFVCSCAGYTISDADALLAVKHIVGRVR